MPRKSRGGRGAGGGATRGTSKSQRGGSTRRGRGGGRRGGRLASAAPAGPDISIKMDKDVPDDGLDIDKDIRKFFIGVASFEKHREAQIKNPSRYTAGLALLIKNGVEISANAKVRALAAAWSRHDRIMSQSFLGMRSAFGLVEVLKAVTLLDSGRQLRQLEKQLQRLELNASKAGVTLRKSTLAKYKVKIGNLTAMKLSTGSVSGSLCRQIIQWAGSFTKEELEYFALQMPKEPWKQLADIVHFNPNHFPACPWFLKFCFGEPPPEDSVVFRAKNVTAETINQVLDSTPLPFTFLREHQAALNDQSKAAIVRAEDKVDRAIWWYEELACESVDEEILKRLQSGELVDLPYGKLMERLVTLNKKYKEKLPGFYDILMQQATEKLSSIRLVLESPVVVLADASSSMDVAIETATIVSSILTACCQAELVFFNQSAWRPATSPRTIQEVVDMAITTQASGSTSPAASLWPFYENKQEVRTFIVVTDEEENTNCHDCDFTALYKKYREEVFAANLIFISFLRNQTDPGDMVPKLRAVEAPVRQFVMSSQRPDLSKLDNILGQLSAETEDFAEELKRMQITISEKGMVEVYRDLLNPIKATPAGGDA